MNLPRTKPVKTITLALVYQAKKIVEEICANFDIAHADTSIHQTLSGIQTGLEHGIDVSAPVVVNSLINSVTPYQDSYATIRVCLKPGAISQHDHTVLRRGGDGAVQAWLVSQDTAWLVEQNGRKPHIGAEYWQPGDHLRSRFHTLLRQLTERKNPEVPPKAVTDIKIQTGHNFDKLSIHVDMRDGDFLVTDTDQKYALSAEQLDQVMPKAPVKVSSEKFQDIQNFVSGSLVQVKLDAGDRPNFTEDNLKYAESIAYHLKEIIEGRDTLASITNPVARAIIQRALQYFN